MMPAQLWETTMDPEQRILKQLAVEDAAEANVVFSSLMGVRVSSSAVASIWINLVFSYMLKVAQLTNKEPFQQKYIRYLPTNSFELEKISIDSFTLTNPS